MPINRREFLSGSAAFTMAAPILALPGTGVQDTNSPERARSEVRLGVAGLNSRGNALTQSFHGLPDVRIAALCDVDSRVLQRRAEEMEAKGTSVETFADFRSMIESDSIDAVVIATPNHWHALMAVWACDAGKHVYVEKPVSHNVREGRAIVEAAARNNRVCQTGTQSRSSHAVRSAIEYAHSGVLGRVTCARGICYKPRRSIGRVSGPRFVPETIDYHRWLGPAPYEPLRRSRLHYDWHWYDQTGNGDLGNQGVHQMDIARWGAGHDRLPDRAWSVGGRIGYDDDGNTPNTQVIGLEYDGGAPIIFEVRGLPRSLEEQSTNWAMDSFHGMSIGVVLHCEDGEIRIPTGYSEAVVLDSEGREVKRWSGGGNHQANFIEAVRAEDPGLLNAPIIEGHLSSACCHVGMVSHEIGRDGTIGEAIVENSGEHAREALQRMARHMEANGLSDEMLVLGPRIGIDTADERPVDAQIAPLFTRECREPFTFPAGTS